MILYLFLVFQHLFRDFQCKRKRSYAISNMHSLPKKNPRFGVAVIPMRRLLYRCVNLVLEALAIKNVGFAKELINGVKKGWVVAALIAVYRAVVRSVISLNMPLAVLLRVVGVHGVRRRLERRLKWLW